MAAGWRQNAEYWKQLPALSTARFLLGVFCLFASFSFIFGTVSFGQTNLTPGICFALVNGFAATLWAFTGTRRMFKAMGVVACLQAVANIWLSTVFSKGGGSPTLRFATFERYAFFNAVAAVVSIFAGYSLFIYFFSTEGGRYYGTLTEMRLAGGIHRSLVPEINAALDSF